MDKPKFIPHPDLWNHPLAGVVDSMVSLAWQELIKKRAEGCTTIVLRDGDKVLGVIDLTDGDWWRKFNRD